MTIAADPVLAADGRRERRFFLSLSLPALFIVGLAAILPLLSIVRQSFLTTAGEYSVGNYEKVLSSGLTWSALATTLELSLGTLVACILLGPLTAARVKEVAKRVGYVPDHHGRALKTGRTMTLTAVLPMETSDYLSDLAKLPLIEGMTLAARQTGYSLSIYSTTPGDDPVESMRRLLQARTADGLIITRMVSGDPRVKLLFDQAIPFVTFGRPDLDIAYPYVDIDNEQIAYDATRRLMDKGCRRIALQLLVPKDQASATRLAGYQERLPRPALRSTNR
ncbi:MULTISPECIES: hypothetical protein [unclassified Mesorhizobium]|uniref:hypothetical protein n=1 Tax=unclassified Mesorhizobium TaxID=325217 RepID=UPI001CC98A01|nr:MULTISPECIES: hypothetical protein [unclassified Mesorhizobium]MBZ9739820.1 hypothetical protein [Mesorhizobium sp. CO1-1-4]MBZ9805631.1 hypothetical protein [Mesorhizobium sp. ES1-6]